MTGYVSLFPLLLAGFALYSLIPFARWGSAFLDLPLIFGLGCSVLFIPFLLLSWFGPVSLTVLYVTLLPVFLLWYVKGSRLTLKRKCFPLSLAERWLFVALIVALLLPIVFTLLLPLLDFESRILWALKAKVLAIDPTVTGEFFRDPYRLHIHPRYPLLVPFLGSWMARHQGEFLEVHYQSLIALFSLLAMMQLYTLLRRFTLRRTSMTLIIVVALSGVWVNSQFMSGVEIVLVFYLLLALHSLFRWLEGEREFIFLLFSGFFLFCAAMTKNDGILITICFILSLFLVQLTRCDCRIAFNASAALAGTFLFLFSFWLSHLYFIPPVSDENYLQRLSPEFLFAGLNRLPLIVKSLWIHISGLQQWHFLWCLPLLSMLTVRSWKNLDLRWLFLMGFLILYLLGILFVYLLSPWRDIEMQINVTFDRVMLPLLPVFILLFASAKGEPVKGAGCEL